MPEIFNPASNVFRNPRTRKLKILASVKEYFKTFSAKEITEFSHKEKRYPEVLPGRLISYAYADELKI